MRFQRIIYDSLNNIAIFASRDFHFTNFKFIDLNCDVPKHEKSDFFINELYPQQNVRQMEETFKVILEMVFHQKPEDLPKAKRRHFYVKIFSRLYQVSAYCGLLWAVSGILDRTLLQIDFKNLFFDENFEI
jgi:hypothetical protein